MNSDLNACGRTGEGTSVGVCEGNLFKADLLHEAAFNKHVGFLSLT